MGTVMKAVVVALIIGLLGPLALSTIFGTSTSGWSANAATYWPYVGLILIVAFILILLGIAVSSWMGRRGSL